MVAQPASGDNRGLRLEIEPPNGEVLCAAGKAQALVGLVLDVTLRVRE
jgi:hypothetical protein